MSSLFVIIVCLSARLVNAREPTWHRWHICTLRRLPLELVCLRMIVISLSTRVINAHEPAVLGVLLVVACPLRVSREFRCAEDYLIAVLKNVLLARSQYQSSKNLRPVLPHEDCVINHLAWWRSLRLRDYICLRLTQ